MINIVLKNNLFFIVTIDESGNFYNNFSLFKRNFKLLSCLLLEVEPI